MSTTETATRATTDSPAEAPRRTPHPLLALVGMTLGLGALLTLLLALFILPSLKSGPHGLEIGVAGDPVSTSQVQQVLTAGDTDAYDIRSYDTRADLVAAVRDRDVVGGFVVADQVEAVTASAGSATIAGHLSATAQSIGHELGAPVTVDDVVPLPETDPTGIGIGGLAFPLVFGGIVPVVAFRAAMPHSQGWRLAGLLTFSGAGGLVVAAVLRFWFGSIDSNMWPVAGAMTLGIAAMAYALSGLQEAFGGTGFTIGAMVMMFLGNPFSGIATTGAWLPDGLGAVGQLLPPGATGTLVRAAAYFDGTGGLTAALTLVAWVVVGLALHAVGARRTSPSSPVETPGRD